MRLSGVGYTGCQANLFPKISNGYLSTLFFPWSSAPLENFYTTYYQGQHNSPYSSLHSNDFVLSASISYFSQPSAPSRLSSKLSGSLYSASLAVKWGSIPIPPRTSRSQESIDGEGRSYPLRPIRLQFRASDILLLKWLGCSELFTPLRSAFHFISRARFHYERQIRSSLSSSVPVFCHDYSIHAELSEPPKQLQRMVDPFHLSNKQEEVPSIIRPPILHFTSNTSQCVKKGAPITQLPIRKPGEQPPRNNTCSTDKSEAEMNPTVSLTADLSNADTINEQFPYVCPAAASVRIYHGTKKPWWKVMFAGISLLFFIMVWIVSAFFPLYLLYWSLNQAHVIYCHGNNKHNIFLEPPPLLQFYRKLKEAVRDLLMLPTYLVQVTPSLVASITTLRISSVATSCVSVSTTTYRRIADMVYCLDWRSRVCLAYLGSIVIINIRDIFKGPLKIPRFVKTLDDANISNFEKLRLRMMRCTLDWFLPGSALVFEDYRAFVSCGRFNNSPTLICYHPHGIISLGLFHLLSLPELEGYKIMAAPMLKFFSPLFRFTFSRGYVTLGSADRMSFTKSMEDKESLILVPGGVHEATITDYGKEQLYLKNRKGFIRYSLQHGYSITPVYAFGENICYSHLLSNILRDVKFWFNSKGIPTVLPFGPLYWPVGVLPYRVPTLIVVGAPMKLPKIDRPNRDEVEYYHEKYIQEVRRLYLTYADSYYRYCKTRYNIEIPASSREDNEKAITSLPHAPPLLLW